MSDKPVSQTTMDDDQNGIVPHAGTLEEASREIDRLRKIVDRARPLIALLTVRQVIEAGDDAIIASGLNPWCLNEALADGSEHLDTWWLS